jgi:putative FmdB family regulatory protein
LILPLCILRANRSESRGAAGCLSQQFVVESLLYYRIGGSTITMPIYEYECDSCRIRFERLQHFKDEPIKECPECGGGVHRVLQPVGIIFKGSGFYITDHRQLSSAASPAQKALAAPKESDEKKAATASQPGKPAPETAETKATTPSARGGTASPAAVGTTKEAAG